MTFRNAKKTLTIGAQVRMKNIPDKVFTVEYFYETKRTIVSSSDIVVKLNDGTMTWHGAIELV
jgi:hypothetical protein